jgi:hypothetical protein
VVANEGNLLQGRQQISLAAAIAQPTYLEEVLLDAGDPRAEEDESEEPDTAEQARLKTAETELAMPETVRHIFAFVIGV